MQNLLNGLLGAMGNPAQTLQKIGLTPDALQNPNAAIQNLMNSGKMTQEQYNSLYQQAQQLQGNPQVQQMLQRMLGK